MEDETATGLTVPVQEAINSRTHHGLRSATPMSRSWKWGGSVALPTYPITQLQPSTTMSFATVVPTKAAKDHRVYSTRPRCQSPSCTCSNLLRLVEIQFGSSESATESFGSLRPPRPEPSCCRKKHNYCSPKPARCCRKRWGLDS